MKFKNIIYEEKFYNRHVEPFSKKDNFEEVKLQQTIYYHYCNSITHTGYVRGGRRFLSSK